MPVRKIADAAKRKNIDVLVDGAIHIRPVRIHASRTQLRLFWHQPAQMVGGADRNRIPVYT